MFDVHRHNPKISACAFSERHHTLGYNTVPAASKNEYTACVSIIKNYNFAVDHSITTEKKVYKRRRELNH
jgi:hypothetical protein